MEYCREVVDKQIFQSIVEDNLTKTERYYFFPSLVSLKRPDDKWSNDHAFSCKCGWLIQCTDENEFFSPCMIQTLLLRLTFSFTPKKIKYDTSDLITHKRNKQSVENSIAKSLVIKRLCSVWYNGIYWQEESGVKTIVDVINQRTLVLLMQCSHDCEIDLVKRRSQVISMILSAKQEFSSEAEVLEYFIHPSCVTHPLANLETIQNWLFSFPRVKSTIEKKQPCVINEHDNSIKLEDLLYFEPYSQLSMGENKSKIMRTYKERIEQLSIFRGCQPPQGYGEALSMMAVPRLHQLDLIIDCEGKRVRIIQSAASKWKHLATRLHFEPSDINRIRSDHPIHCYDACWQVCSEWLEGIGRQPTSWKTLIKALNEAELGEIATDLETIISRGIS